MKYLIERSLYYHFLMQEIVGTEADTWGFVAKSFGVAPKDIKAYEKVLKNRILTEFLTAEDIDMYKNYLSSSFCIEGEFGKAKIEQEVIEAKLLALHKAQEFFDNSAKGNRLTYLSQNYKNDYATCVLYALQVIFQNRDKNGVEYIQNFLEYELQHFKNSDAGLILLTLNKGKAESIFTELKKLPGIVVRPDVVKYLSKKYKSDEVVVFNYVHNIGLGFGGDRK